MNVGACVCRGRLWWTEQLSWKQCAPQAQMKRENEEDGLVVGNETLQWSKTRFDFWTFDTIGKEGGVYLLKA